MSAVVYVACQTTAECPSCDYGLPHNCTCTTDAWDVCRIEDLAGHCELVARPIIFGLRTEQAFEYVAHLNDDLKWAKELCNASTHSRY